MIASVQPSATTSLTQGVGLPDNDEGSEAQPIQSIGSNDPNASSRFTNGRGHPSQVKLDQHGHPTQITDAIGRVTTIQRDVDSNPTQTTRPNGSVVTQTFDDQGNELTRTEATNNARTTFTYDAFSQLTSITNPNQHTTTLTRDGQGNVTQITNALCESAKGSSLSFCIMLNEKQGGVRRTTFS